MYRVVFTRQADKDKPLLKRAGLETRAKALLDVLRENPYANPPPFEKLSGDMQGLYSRRINVQHRLVYAIDRETKTVRVLRMWSHYGDN